MTTVKSNAKVAVQAVVLALGIVFASYAESPGMTPTEWTNVAIMAFGVVSVYICTNSPVGTWAYSKTIVAAISAGLVALASVITGGVSTTELAQIAVAILGAAGVLAAPPSVATLRARAALEGDHITENTVA